MKSFLQGKILLLCAAVFAMAASVAWGVFEDPGSRDPYKRLLPRGAVYASEGLKAQKVDPKKVRWLVIAIGCAMTVYFAAWK